MKKFLCLLICIGLALTSKCENNTSKCCSNSQANICNIEDTHLNCGEDEDKTFYLDHYPEAVVKEEEKYCVGYLPSRNRIFIAVCRNSVSTNHKVVIDFVSVFFTHLYSSTSIPIFFSLHTISCVLLLMTAYLYFILPSAQNLCGICIFHYSLNLGIAHGILLGEELLETHEWGDCRLCSVGVHLLIFVVLSSITWSVIMSYNAWTEVKVTTTMTEEKRAGIYYLAGYILPTVLVILAVLQTHVTINCDKIRDKNDWQLKLFMVLTQFLSCPLILAPVINFIFFCKAYTRLYSLFKSRLTESPSFLKKLRFRFRMILTLCVCTNVPMGISVLYYMINMSRKDEIIETIISGVIATEGMLIFLVLVVFRIISNSYGAFGHSIIQISEDKKPQETDPELQNQNTPSVVCILTEHEENEEKENKESDNFE